MLETADFIISLIGMGVYFLFFSNNRMEFAGVCFYCPVC